MPPSLTLDCTALITRTVLPDPGRSKKYTSRCSTPHLSVVSPTGRRLKNWRPSSSYLAFRPLQHAGSLWDRHPVNLDRRSEFADRCDTCSRIIHERRRPFRWFGPLCFSSIACTVSPKSAISTAIQSVLLHPRKTRGGVISLLERYGPLPRTLSPQRLPWVVASAIPVAVSGIVLLLARSVLLPFSSPASISWLATLYGDVSYAIGLGVPVLVGYLFILRFEYSSKGIFITCAASTYVMVTAELLALVGSSPGHTVFDLLWAFVASAFSALLGAILIVAGSGLGRIALARRQAPPG